MDGRASGPALGVAAGAFAVICCAGLPAIGALIGGITIAGVIGVLGGGAIGLMRDRRRRRSCRPSSGGSIQ